MDEQDGEHGDRHSPVFDSNDGIPHGRRQSFTRSGPPSRFGIGLVLLLLLSVTLTNGISAIPLNRLLEQRLCRAYYGSDHDVEEKLCKVDSVQQDLAWIMGSFDTLWIVGGK